MKLFKPSLRQEPVTSAIDAIESTSQDSFPIRKGSKIAELTRSAPFYEVILEMEIDGNVIADWSDRTGIVVEKNIAVNIGRVYKVTGYKHDITDEDLFKKMTFHVKIETLLEGNAITEMLVNAVASGIVAVLG